MKETLLRIEGEKNPAPDENWTHDLSVTRRELYCCAKTAALHIASSIEKGQSHDSVISALSLALVEMIFCSLRVAVSVSRITDLEYILERFQPTCVNKDNNFDTSLDKWITGLVLVSLCFCVNKQMCLLVNRHLTSIPFALYWHHLLEQLTCRLVLVCL